MKGNIKARQKGGALEGFLIAAVIFWIGGLAADDDAHKKGYAEGHEAGYQQGVAQATKIAMEEQKKIHFDLAAFGRNQCPEKFPQFY